MNTLNTQQSQPSVPDDYEFIKLELKKQKQINDLVIDIFSSLAAEPSEIDASTINETLGKICTFVKADRIYVGTYDFHHKVINITDEWCAPEIKKHMDFAHHISIDMEMEIVQVHLKGEIFRVEDVAILPGGTLKKFLTNQHVKSCYAVPMMAEGKCIGFIGLDSIHQPQGYTEDELALMKSFAKAVTSCYQRNEMLKTLRHSEELHRAIAEYAPAMICEYLPDSTLTFVNREYAEYHGAKSEEMVGRSFLEFIDEIHREPIQKIYLSLTPEHTHDVTSQFYYVLGELRWQEWRTKAFFDENGDPIRYQAVGIDITEAKRQQDQIKKQEALINGMLDSIPDLVFFKDLEGVFLGCNTPFAEFYGLTKNRLIGKSNYDFISKKKSDYYHSLDKEVVEKRQALAQEEWVEDVNGNKVLFETMMAPLFTEDGEIIGTIGIARDMTERWYLKQSLLEAKKEAEEANEAKSRFLANMSHELRSPLHGMMGMIGLLRMADSLEEQGEYLTLAERAAQNLLQLTKNVLDYSKVESREMILKNERFIVEELLYDVEIMGNSLLMDKDIVFSIHKSDSVPEELIGDETRLKQVLNNLVSNAVKFTMEGKIEIELTTTAQSDLSNHTVMLLCHVKDTGIGIPSKDIDHIFESFAQAEGAGRNKYGGTGLGLAICKSIVTQMGGEIWVKSEEGVGSKFSFTCKLELPQD
jgi:PAS domain S-box-containing protein